MQRILFLIAIMFSGMCIMLSAPAFAGVHYYLEIGDQVSDQQAAQNWHQLSKAHESLLKGLWYYPKTIFTNGEKSGVRIQAGPVDSKQRAQTICKTLFAADTSCFIIEAMQDSPPESVVRLQQARQEAAEPVAVEADQQGFLPWLTGESSGKEEEPGTFSRLWSWLTGEDQDDDGRGAAPAIAPLPAAVESHDLGNESEAEVEVAEAIRVPLSQAGSGNFTDNFIVVGPQSEAADMAGHAELPPVHALETSPVVTTAAISKARRAPIGNPSSELVSEGAGWLTIAAFHDEEEASAAWQRVHRAAPEKAAGLRVRIIRPFVSQYEAETTLNVGPFPSDEDAMAFCNQQVKTVDSGLVCDFTTDESSRVAASRRVSRRMLMAARRNAQLSTSAGRGEHHRDAKSYWVQVLSAPGQLQALHAWKNLRAAHPDLFSDTRSNVSRLSGQEGYYVVRVGPMAEDNEAKTLCHDLKTRKLDCNIVISSR